MNDFVYYLGLILFLFGLISFIPFLMKIYKKRGEYKTLKEFLLAKKLYFILPPIAFALGIVFLCIAFYNNPYTIEFLAEKGLSTTWFHQTGTYVFGILFALSIFSLFYILYIKLYLENFNLKRKNLNISLTISIIVTIVTFYVFGECNAPYLEYPLANGVYIGAQGIKLINTYTQGTDYSNGFTIYLYAIFILFGACLVLYVCDYKLYKIYGKHDLITNTFLVGFPCGIVGARLWYVVLDVSSGGTNFTGSNWVNIFNFRDGGLGIMGGAILGIIGGVSQILIVKYGTKNPNYKNFDLLQAADIIVPCILFAQAIGRLGNFFNNEVYGGLVDISYWEWLPTWIKNNMYFQHGSVLPGQSLSEMMNNGVFSMPLFFIEFCTNLAGYFILEYGIRHGLKKIHSDGTLIGGYLIWYGLTRVILEPLRTSADYYGTSEITAWVMVIIGVIIVIFFVINNYVFKKKELLWYKKKEVVTNEGVTLSTNEPEKEEEPSKENNDKKE